MSEINTQQQENKKMKIIGYHWPLAARGHYPNGGIMPIYDWNKDEMDDPDLAEKIIKAAKEEIISKKCQKIK